MMNEYEQMFVTNMWQKLKRKIVGNIFVEVNDYDELYVRIYQKDGDDILNYNNRFTHFSERMLNGWSTEYAVYETIKDYRKFITKIMEERYFYND